MFLVWFAPTLLHWLTPVPTGHTHIDQDMVIKGIRYVQVRVTLEKTASANETAIQNAFGHPKERNQPWKILKGPYEPKVVFTVQSEGKEEGTGEKDAGDSKDEDFVEKSDSDDELEYHEVEVPKKAERRENSTKTKKKKDKEDKMTVD